MGVRAKRINITALPEDGGSGPEFVEKPFEHRTTVVNGQELHWAHGQVRNFADDGVGAAHVAFNAGATIIEDQMPFGSARS